jgi:hypothetical protein
VNQLVQPGEQQVRLVPHVAGERLALARFERLEPGSQAGCLVCCQDIDRKAKTVASILRERCLREKLRHRILSRERACPHARAS